MCAKLELKTSNNMVPDGQNMELTQAQTNGLTDGQRRNIIPSPSAEE